MKVFAEHLVHLRSLRINILKDDTESTVTGNLSIKDGYLWLDDLHHLCPVNDFICSIQAAKISVDDSSINISIPTVSKSCPPRNEQPAPSVAALDIRYHLPVKQVVCNTCGNEFLWNSLSAVVDLPSEHWQEVLDCWICHPTEDVMSKLSQVTVKPLKDRLLCGSSYFLIHSDDVNLESVVETQVEVGSANASLFKTSQVFCKKCDDNIGVNFDDRVEDASKQHSSIKFNKYSVNVITENTTFCHPFLECFLFDLWESQQAHAHYKFIICSVETGLPKLLLWVFQWNSSIYFGSELDEATFQNALKCLYLTPESPNWDTVKEQWKKDRLIETFYYPSKECNLIWEHLKANSGHSDQVSKNVMNEFQLGFIARK